MVAMKPRKPKWYVMLSAMGLATVLMASAAHAATSVTVVAGEVSPDPLNLGQTFNVTFSAALEGKPGTGIECEAKNVRWSWHVVVDGGSGPPVVWDNPNGGASFTLNHTANEICSYFVTATATASYEASAECGGNGSASDSGTATAVVEGASCPTG